MARPSDWSPVDMDRDPTPGDPDEVRELADDLREFADDVGEALGKIRGLASERAVLDWAGLSADAFRREFEGVPDNLTKLEDSYSLCSQALHAYWPKLQTAQGMADRALDRAISAQADLASAQSALGDAQDWVGRAGEEAERLQREGERENVEPPDEADVRAAARDQQAAEAAAGAARSRVNDAEERLAAARQLALDAQEMREEAARVCAQGIEEASDAGIQNRRWWEKAIKWVTDNWDTIVAVCKVIVAVLGVVVMIIGGPLAWVVLAAALVVLADTLIKYARGEAGLLDVAFAALDCIPGMKGLTTLGGLARGLRGGLSAAKTGLRGLGQGIRGLGQGLRRMGRQGDNLICRTDPIDMATGEMVMEAVDVELQGVLPLVIRRHHRSSLREGTWFGPSWASTLDQRIVLDAGGGRLVTDDGMILDYPAPPPDTPVLPVEGPRWPLAWSGEPGDPLTVHRPDNGQTLHFAPVPGRRGGELPLVAITDRNDNRISVEYDADGAPSAVVHHGGYRVGIATRDRRITELRLLSHPERPRLLAYGYDRAGNLAEVVNSSDLPLRLRYDEKRRITGWEDRNGVTYAYEYDEAGRCVATRGVHGFLDSRIVYEPEQYRTRFTDSLGNTTVYEFNDSYQLIAETDPLGNRTERAWDRYDRLVSVTDPVGRTVTYAYDETGELTRIERANGHALDIVRDERGFVTELAEADGSRWRMEYDERGNNTVAVAADGSRTRWEFDATGAMVAVTDALGRTTRLSNDAAGLPIAETDPLGATTVHRRDAFGRIVATVDPLGSTATAEWSVEGHQLSLTDATGATRRWAYDGEGNRVCEIDENGGITRDEYGPFDVLTARTTPDGARTTWRYTTELAVAEVTNPLGQTWSYQYDAAGRMIAERDFEGREVRYEKDPAGQVTARTNAEGQRAAFTYGPLGQVIRKDVDGQVTTYEHDATGRLVRAEGPHAEVTFDRDITGRIVAESVNGRTLRYRYDAMGRVNRRTTPSGRTTDWSYDAADRVTGLRVGGRSLGFAYDAAGRETGRTIEGAPLLEQRWDAEHRLLEQRVTGGDRTLGRAYRYRADHRPVVIGGTRLTLDAMGRVTEVGGGDRQESYAYDAAGNVAASRLPDEEAPQPHERAGRVVRAGRFRYEYDRAGRIVIKQRVRLSRKPDTWRYTWDGEDRLVEVTTPDGTRFSYLHDPVGRRIAKLRHAADGSVAEREDFAWFGTTLVERTAADGTVTTWDYHGLHPVAQTEGRVPRPGEGGTATLAKSEVDDRFWAIVTDLVGTPTELVSPDGKVASAAPRTLWGAPAPGTDEPAGVRGELTPLRFPGQYADEETGWHYNLHRHYDPHLARYASPDPLGLMPAPNATAYVDNPTTTSDPLGLISCALSRYADRLQFRAGKQGVKFASEYTSPAGVTYFGHNVKGQINFVPGGVMERLVRDQGHHGHCAEIMALAKAEWREGPAALRGGSMDTVRVRSPRGDQAMHGQPAHPCESNCQPLLDALGIGY
ncbi:DUF6531 domain-containing protein [Streptomyces triticirhizae]|uniref:DUF6531 domain-containing protein n=1 Tax=Streptomyces triticirhizae TaxID=2483353 RepID=UPI0011C44038|nr:DUF6531 domain-containing protein [Streptomyces triticirhizae]